MKFYSLVVAVLLLGAVFAQDETLKPRDKEVVDKPSPAKSIDPLGNIRFQFTGKYGQNESTMAPFGGWWTHVTNGPLELSHVQARLLPSPSVRSAGNDNEGAIYHMYQFYDRNSRFFRSFHMKQQNETDIGSCYELWTGSENSKIDSWKQSTQQCGPTSEGKVWTRRYRILGDDGRSLMTFIMALCLEQGKFSGEIQLGDSTMFVMDANVTNILAQPSINDKTTFAELAVPFTCQIMAQPFDPEELAQDFLDRNTDNTDRSRSRDVDDNDDD